MARNGVFSRRWRSDGDLSPSVTHEVHVLAVDDSLVDRRVIERLLKITSCKVTAVDSGRRALQYLGLDEDKNSAADFDGLKVDLIITDYCMPGMTGYELLKRIKGSATFRQVPVVIMSSENVLARIDRCLEEGAEDFIVKPVKLSDVKRLKDYMFGENGNGVEDKGINKRKLQEMSDLSTSTLPPLISPSASPPSISPSPLLESAISLSQSPPPLSSPPAPSPPLILPSTSLPLLSLSPSSPSLNSSTLSMTPCSPSLLDSPTIRLEMTNCD